jgi:hypothetical protein
MARSFLSSLFCQMKNVATKTAKIEVKARIEFILKA